MKPRNKLAERVSESGDVLALYEHDASFAINFNGQELMHSRASASETLLGEIGVERIAGPEAARVLIGGLGLGFTLRSALDRLPGEASIEVVELIAEVIDWNRGYLQTLNGNCLDDPRVAVRAGNVISVIRQAPPQSYDSIILDTDNGPTGLVEKSNENLYSKSGIRTIRTSLKEGGRAVFWSAGPDATFEARLRQANFAVQAVPAKVHAGAKRAAYLLYVADKLS